MPQVAHQAVRDVQRRMRQPPVGQQTAQRHARRRRVQARARPACEVGVGQRDSLQAAGQRQARRRPACRKSRCRRRRCAASRRSAGRARRSPKMVMQMFSGPLVVSPPISSQPWASASANRPREKPSSQAGSAAGSARASVKPSGAAPIAARSDRFTARHLWPSVERDRRRRRNGGLRPACRTRWPAACRARAPAARSRRRCRARCADPTDRCAARTGEVAIDEVEFGEHPAILIRRAGRGPERLRGRS